MPEPLTTMSLFQETELFLLKLLRTILPAAFVDSYHKQYAS